MAIKLVYYSETFDNWGRSESSEKPAYIYERITNTEDWSDDLWFEDEERNVYYVDDLIGKEVIVEGYDKFIFPSDEE